MGRLPAGLARRTPRFPRPGFVDREDAASDLRAVEGVHGAVRRAAVRHLDEAKAALPGTSSRDLYVWRTRYSAALDCRYNMPVQMCTFQSPFPLGLGGDDRPLHR